MASNMTLKFGISLLILSYPRVKCTLEFGVYVKETQHRSLLLVRLHVDNLIVTRNVQAEIKQFKVEMKS